MTENLDIAAPVFIGIASSLSVMLFDQPLAVFLTAIGGALWAVWRNRQMGFLQGLVAIIVAAVTACVMVGFVVWLLALIGAGNAPVRGLAGLIAFVVIDKTWRDKVLVFLGAKLEAKSND